MCVYFLSVSAHIWVPAPTVFPAVLQFCRHLHFALPVFPPRLSCVASIVLHCCLQVTGWFGGAITFCASFFVSAALSLFIIAISWVWYRPMVAAALVVAGLVPLYLSRQANGNGNANGAPNAEQAKAGANPHASAGRSHDQGRQEQANPRPQQEPSAPPAYDAGQQTTSQGCVAPKLILSRFPCHVYTCSAAHSTHPRHGP